MELAEKLRELSIQFGAIAIEGTLIDAAELIEELEEEIAALKARLVKYE